MRSYDTRGFSVLLNVFRHYLVLRTLAWQAVHSNSYRMWDLPTDLYLVTAKTVAAWFKLIVDEHGCFSHHSCRRTGASAALNLLIPLAKIFNWGNWSPGSSAVWNYINPQRSPSAANFRLFEWMLVTVEEIRRDMTSIFTGYGQ